MMRLPRLRFPFRRQARLRSLLVLVMACGVIMGAVSWALRPRPEMPCIYVQGDAVAPGRQPFSVGMTAWSAIRAAGGLAPSGDRQNIRLVRDKSPAPVVPVDLNDSATDYRLMPGDRVVVYRLAKAQAGGSSNDPESK